MKTTARIIILAALGVVALAALMAVPADNAPSWHSTLIGSKAAALGLFFISHRLHTRWFPANYSTHKN